MGISLRHLGPGGFFVAAANAGARAICQITDVDCDVVKAWRITTQEVLTFQPDTGLELGGGDRFFVTSVEQPPDDIRETMLNLDRRYRIGGSPALSKDEIRSLNWFA